MIEIGDSFGSYTVVQRLGKGGMGEVWLLEAASGAQVAAKILDPETAGDHEARKRFLREAQLALGVKHPNLVETYDVGEDPDTGLCYILMEYVAGGTLADYLKENGALPIEDAVAVVEAIAGVLELGRQKGIVHRDIKPANIMFAADGTPKLADLGIARGGSSGTETTTVTQTGMMIGTPAYMAPEQMLDAHNVDTRADIYSLGVVFFEMLTGERPNKDDTVVQLMAKAVKGEPLPDVRTLRPEVSASLAQLLGMMVAPDKEGRISTPGQITNALSIIKRGGKFVSRVEMERKQREIQREVLLRKRAQRRRLMVAGVGVVIAALIAAVVVLAMRKPTTRIVRQAPAPVVRPKLPETAPTESVRTIQKEVVVTKVVTNVVEAPRPVAVAASKEKSDEADEEVKPKRRPKSDGKVYAAKVGKYTWFYRLENGEAIISRSKDDFVIEKVGPAIDPLPIGRVEIPSSLDGNRVRAIGSYAFDGCDNLTEVIVPDPVRELRGWRSFKNCALLKSVRLPDSLETISGAHVFANCRNLEEVDIRHCRVIDGFSVTVNNPRLRCATDNRSLSLDANGAIYNYERTILMRWPKWIADVRLPDSIKQIGRAAFFECPALEIQLPSNIEEFEPQAFWGAKFRDIHIPKSVKRLHGGGTFAKCKSLRRVFFEGDAPELDDAKYEYCSVFGLSLDDLVIYVKRGSKGWRQDGGEGLPEMWPENQLVKRRIRYLDEMPVDQKATASTPVKSMPTQSFDIGKGVKMEFVECPAGTFTMGRPGDKDRTSGYYEHQVKITRPFWMMKHPITEEIHQALFGPEELDEAQKALGPKMMRRYTMGEVEEMYGSMNESRALGATCNSLTKKFRAKLPRGYLFRLPTEAEWEYAYRAGCTDETDVYYTPYYASVNAMMENGLKESVWTSWDTLRLLDGMNVGQYRARGWLTVGKERGAASYGRAGCKRPNAWGLYDMCMPALFLERFDAKNAIEGMRRKEAAEYAETGRKGKTFAAWADLNKEYRLLSYAESEVDPVTAYIGVGHPNDNGGFAYFSGCHGDRPYKGYPRHGVMIRLVIGPDLIKEKGLDKGSDKDKWKGEAAADRPAGEDRPSSYTPAQVKRMQDSDPTRAVQKALDVMFPGWKTSEVGDSGNLGYLANHNGEEDVLCTHPPRVGVSTVLSRTVTVSGNSPVLHVRLSNNEPSVEFRLRVRVAGNMVREKDINAGWTDVCVDLRKWIGKTVKIELEHMPTGWRGEWAFWSVIEIVDDAMLLESAEIQAKDKPPKLLDRKQVNGSNPRKAVQRACDALFPGWKVSACASGNRVGYEEEHHGRYNLLYTHPPQQDVPVVISRRMTLKGKSPKLLVSVIGGEDFELQVKVNGKIIQRPDIFGDRWTDLTVDLSPWAGRTVLIELLNMPTGWRHEEAHWQRIEVQ